MSTTRIFRRLPWEGRKEVSAQLFDSRNWDWKSLDRNWRVHAPEVMSSWISPAVFRKTLMESQRAWCVCAPRRFTWTGFTLPLSPGRITSSFLLFLLHRLHRSRCRLLHTWEIFGVGFLNCAWNIASTLEMILMSSCRPASWIIWSVSHPFYRRNAFHRLEKEQASQHMPFVQRFTGASLVSP